jgi:undecaprenyl-diphosphatase
MLLATLIGQPPVPVAIAAGVFGYGIALGKPQYVTAGTIAVVTFAIGSLLKLFLRRARPANDYVRSMLIQTFSFPSGHAVGSVVCFGLAALVTAVHWPEYAVAIWLSTVVLCILIGISRIYLGAHYASDVLGGWIVGGVGLAVIIIEFVEFL